MQTENDPKLKLAMAKLLPDLLEIRTVSPCAIGANQKDTYQVVWWRGKATALLETEWLYVMHLVEQKLSEQKGELKKYLYQLEMTIPVSGSEVRTSREQFKYVTATFNQRATAMCHVEGIDINTI